MHNLQVSRVKYFKNTMAKPLTKKQKIFVQEFLDTGNGTQSAMKAYDTESETVAAVIASENIRKPNIMAMIQDAAEDAFSVIVELSKGSENDSVRLGASKDILDRSGFKPVDKQQINMEVSSKPIDPTNIRVMEQMKALQETLENE